MESAGWRLLGGAWAFPSAERMLEPSAEGVNAWLKALKPLAESVQVSPH